MMTFNKVQFVGGYNNQVQPWAGNFTHQDYMLQFSDGHNLWVNLDNYNEAIDTIECEISMYADKYNKTISEAETSRAIEALKECYELNKYAVDIEGYIERIAEMLCNDTIVAGAGIMYFDDITEVYVVNYTNNEDGSKDKVIAVWDKRTPEVVRFPEDWEMNIKAEDLLDNNGKVFIPEEYWFRPYCLINGQVTEC